MKKNTQSKVAKKKSYRKDNIQLMVMILPVLILLLIFSYWPMYGVVLAFKKYSVVDGIWGSKWVGLKNIEFFFRSSTLFRIIRNTLCLNFMFIGVGTVMAVTFALLMFEVKQARHVKLYQTVSILPNFISWVAVSYMVFGLLDHDKGLMNTLIQRFGGEGVKWYNEPVYWPIILLIVTLWNSVGMGSIIYYASLLSVDQELFEAADIDGASKWQKTRYVSIPQLIPIITIRTIMSIGGIFRSDFGLFYNVTRNQRALYKTTDVIDTYVYRAMLQLNDYGVTGAIGLFQSVIGFVLVVTVNTITKKLDSDSALF